MKLLKNKAVFEIFSNNYKPLYDINELLDCDILIKGVDGFEINKEVLDLHYSKYYAEITFDTELKEDFVKELVSKISQHNGIFISKINVYKDDTNWLEKNNKDFQPFKVENFLIFSEYNSLKELPTNNIPLVINECEAFGTGRHETTELCLCKLYDLKQEGFIPKTILDLGTGSGILAIAAKKLFLDTKIIGIDIDEKSIEIANNHQKLNNINDIEFILTKESFDKELKNIKFDVIISNLFFNPLVDLSAKIVSYLNKGGRLIISGFYEDNVNSLIETYTKLGLILYKQSAKNTWAALYFKKP